jgi:hypothetical protein
MYAGVDRRRLCDTGLLRETTYSAKRHTYPYSYTEAEYEYGYEYGQGYKAEQNLAADAQKDGRR